MSECISVVCTSAISVDCTSAALLVNVFLSRVPAAWLCTCVETCPWHTWDRYAENVEQQNRCVGPPFLCLHGGRSWHEHIEDPHGNNLQCGVQTLCHGCRGGGGGKMTPAATSTTPVCQLLGSANGETTPHRTQAAAAISKHTPDVAREGKNG